MQHFWTAEGWSRSDVTGEPSAHCAVFFIV